MPPGGRDAGIGSILAVMLLVAVVPVALWVIEHPTLARLVLGGYTATHGLLVTRRRLEGE